jgi:hypothetical protein
VFKILCGDLEEPYLSDGNIYFNEGGTKMIDVQQVVSTGRRGANTEEYKTVITVLTVVITLLISEPDCE